MPAKNREWFLRARNHRIPLESRVLIMGILNVTPDSFVDGGQYFDPSAAVDHAQAMIAQGADMIDVGAESSRPGAETIDEMEEMRRLKPVLRVLGSQTSIPISVDTRKASVAQMAIDSGAVMINDISALRFDAAMGQVVADAKAGLVIMHMHGTPQTMQQAPVYADVVHETKAFLADRMQAAQAAGIEAEQILLDPGIGFGKNIDHNLTLLRQLESFHSLGQPLMIGVSRKSFIGQLLDKPVEDRLMGTAAVVAAAVMHGAQVVRVHDVAPMRDVVRMAEVLRNGQHHEGAEGYS